MNRSQTPLKNECLRVPSERNETSQNDEVTDTSEEQCFEAKDHENYHQAIEEKNHGTDEEESSIPLAGWNPTTDGTNKANSEIVTLNEGDRGIGSEDHVESQGFSREGQKYVGDQPSDDPHVLDPDSPLMKKFQKALRELLQKQLLKLNDEVVELSYSLRKKSREREDLGVSLFNLQEEVAHADRQISAVNKSVLELEETRTTMNSEVNKLREIHKKESEKISELKRQEEELRLEIEVLKSYECSLRKWENEYNSELAVSQRIADKTEKQKEEKAYEKQKQDILLLRLRQAVLGLESRRDQLQAQREVKLQQQESLRRTIAEGSTDLEALQKEQIRLTRVWNGVVISLQQRDRVYNDVQRDYVKVKESFQLMLSEIESYRKEAKAEMQLNEKKMNVFNRLESEYSDLKRMHENNSDLVSQLEADYAHTTGLVKQTEENLRSALMDGKVLTQQTTYQQRELERLTLQKLSLETDILDLLQNQSKHDKAFQHLARTIRSLKDSNKNQEVLFITMENHIARTMVDIEKVKGTVVLNEKLMAEATRISDTYASDIAQLEGTIKHNTTVMENKMVIIDQLSKKLDGILARLGITEESPQEIRIKAIELEIEEISQECEKKQAFWLRLQAHIVRLSEERQAQLQQLNLLYKQIHILNQRALKIEHETVKHNEGSKNIERQMHALNVSLNKMTIALCNKRGYKEALDKENYLIQAEALGLLKEMERANIEQEEEIMSCVENNQLLNQDILDLKHECLAWEKKLHLALETKQMNEEEKKADGEFFKMRVEIQRMDTRFSQLRKAQETMVRDLENCIMRREALLDQADAKEKRLFGHSKSISNRIVFERKLENLSNRTKQANAETKLALHKLHNELPKEKTALSAALDEENAGLEIQCTAISEGKKNLEEAQLLKLQKLELIVRLQKKVKLYTKVKEGKHKLLFRTESALEAETYRHRSINEALLGLITVLQQHFPSLHLQCARLNNILQASCN